MDQIKSSTLRDQSGAALVIALIMMILLTLVGLAANFSSTIEIMLSGHKRGSTDAFYAADSGVHATVASLENFNLARYGSSNRYVDALNDTSGGKIYSNPTNAYVVLVHDTTQSGCPRGSGFGQGEQGVDCLHFLVTSTARDQLDLSTGSSTSTIDQKVVRLVPK